MDAQHGRSTMMLPGFPAWLAAWCCFLPAAAAAAAPPQRVDLIRDVPTAGDLAAPANGQTLYVLEESTGNVLGIDPFEPTKRWPAVTWPGKDGGVQPAAIGSIDTGTLVLLCRGAAGWSLQSHRVQPGVAADAGAPAQTVRVAAAATDASAEAGGRAAARPAVAVSPSRDWLAVCGLGGPAPALLRAPIAGSRIGAVSTRACPQLPESVRPAAFTISAADEFVIFAPDPAAKPGAGLFASFCLPAHPLRLLHVDTSLPRIHDAAFCRADGTLWVVGGEPGSTTSPEGLWRIDAALRHGRQEARAVCVARLEAATSLACLSERAIVVTHGRPSRIVSRIDPTQDAADDAAPPRTNKENSP